MSNPYFKNTYFPDNNEAKLYADATNEVIQIRGIDMYYLPRTLIKEDHIFGEDTLSEFKSNVPVCFYIENYSAYDGMDDVFSKFGFSIDNQLTLLVSISEFKGVVGSKPLEGDLIFHPVGNRIFEIVDVDEKDESNGFFQFNHREYSYKLTCKMFEYSHEDIDTNIDEIDIINDQEQDTSDESDQLEDYEDILDLSETDIFGNV